MSVAFVYITSWSFFCAYSVLRVLKPIANHYDTGNYFPIVRRFPVSEHFLICTINLDIQSSYSLTSMIIPIISDQFQKKETKFVKFIPNSFSLSLSLYIYIYIYISSSSSSCRTGSTDIPGPLSPLFPIVRRLWQVFWTTSRILT